jgi:5'-nucleotidase
MKILLCNDDGYQAPGIVALHAALAAFADVEVVAPSTTTAPSPTR